MFIVLGDVRIEITRVPRPNAEEMARRTYEKMKAAKAYEDARRMYETKALQVRPMGPLTHRAGLSPNLETGAQRRQGRVDRKGRRRSARRSYGASPTVTVTLTTRPSR
jgi:hypothetical protein